jgi:hypothetical protein
LKLAKKDILSADGDVASVRHGIARIHAKIEQNHGSAKISCDRVDAFWLNPRTGGATRFEVPEKTRGAFTRRAARTWVLVLDDATKKYKTPGLAAR